MEGHLKIWSLQYRYGFSSIILSLKSCSLTPWIGQNIVFSIFQLSFFYIIVKEIATKYITIILQFFYSFWGLDKNIGVGCRVKLINWPYTDSYYFSGQTPGFLDPDCWYVIYLWYITLAAPGQPVSKHLTFIFLIMYTILFILALYSTVVSTQVCLKLNISFLF